MAEQKPSVVHTSTAVLIKYGNEYFSITEEKKLFPLLDKHPWFMSELINELAVEFADTANKTAQDFHKTGTLNMTGLDVYIKALIAYSLTVSEGYTRRKIRAHQLENEEQK